LKDSNPPPFIPLKLAKTFLIALVPPPNFLMVALELWSIKKQSMAVSLPLILPPFRPYFMTMVFPKKNSKLSYNAFTP
jgi:hypothetical protein